jgi:hypothetical protein
MAADPLLACWRRTEDLHMLRPPASADEIAAAEAELNLPLPDLLRQIYLFSKGPWLFGGCCNLDVLRNPEGLSLTTSSRLLREWEWPIPDEVLVFGGDGSEEVYGLWLGARDQARFPDPVLAFVEGAGPFFLATGLRAFLTAETAIHLALEGRGQVAVDCLGAPRALVGHSEPDELAIRYWADPLLQSLPFAWSEEPIAPSTLRALLS